MGDTAGDWRRTTHAFREHAGSEADILVSAGSPAIGGPRSGGSGPDFPAADPRYELALVVVRATDLVPVEWAKAEPPSVGRWVVAPGRDGTAIAAGTIGAVNVAAPAIQPERIVGAPGIVRPSARQGMGYRSYPELVWHTAWLEAAELGGPLVDLHGKAFGVAIERPSEVAGSMVPVAVIQEFLTTHAAAATPPGQRTSVAPAATRGQP